MTAGIHTTAGVAGSANGLAAGTVSPGESFYMGRRGPADRSRYRSISAVVNVTAATSGLTFTGKWQGSDDGAAWADMASANNAANVALATGTSAATGPLAIDAPRAAYAYRYVRFAVVNGVQTGSASDVYSIALQYREVP